MSRSDTIATYFMKISQLKDQLKAIGDTVTDDELMTITLNGFASSWDPFVEGICSKDVLPKFEQLWNHGVQEEVGTTVFKKRPDFCQSKVCRDLQRTEHKHWPPMRGREGDPSTTKDLSARKDRSMLMVMSARRKIFLMNSNTMLLSVLMRRGKESNMYQLPTLIMFLERKQKSQISKIL